MSFSVSFVLDNDAILYIMAGIAVVTLLHFCGDLIIDRIYSK